MGSLNQQISEMKVTAMRIKTSLVEAINNLPDNPNIKRIEGNTNCFIVTMGEIIKSENLNLDPGYYDFTYQYRHLIEKIDRVDILDLDTTMKNIIETGKFSLAAGKNIHGQNTVNTIKLHPEVIKKLKSLLE